MKQSRQYYIEQAEYWFRNASTIADEITSAGVDLNDYHNKIMKIHLEFCQTAIMLAHLAGSENA